MQGMSDIMALYAEGASSLCVNGSVDMLGRLAGISGISASKYTGYPPYDDAPKEGEFDWEGFTRKPCNRSWSSCSMCHWCRN